MKAGQKALPSDLVYELANLGRLLDVITETLMEMDYAMADGSRNHALDRVASLHRIASDHVSHLEEGVAHLDLGGGQC